VEPEIWKTSGYDYERFEMVFEWFEMIDKAGPRRNFLIMQRQQMVLNSFPLRIFLECHQSARHYFLQLKFAIFCPTIGNPEIHWKRKKTKTNSQKIGWKTG
jgi:hypothetical protein